MTGGTLVYTAALVESIAARVVQLLQDESGTGRGFAGAGKVDSESLVSAAEIAKRYGLSVDTVYAHAAAWGGIKVGTGPRAHWRFDPEAVAEHLAPRPDPRAVPNPPKPAPRRRTPNPDIPLLPIRKRRAT